VCLSVYSGHSATEAESCVVVAPATTSSVRIVTGRAGTLSITAVDATTSPVAFRIRVRDDAGKLCLNELYFQREMRFKHRLDGLLPGDYSIEIMSSALGVIVESARIEASRTTSVRAQFR
jgi:hypothetical protein